MPGIRRNKKRGAFTLIELIVVVTIIGILAVLVVPRVFFHVGEARQAVAKQKIAVIDSKVLEFQVDCGRLPTTQEGLRALVQAPSDAGEHWKGPYVKERDILDPWNVEIRYRCPGQHGDFDICSLGADNQEGGTGDNADIGNW